MKLLTKELCASLPKLYEQDGKGEEAIAYVKFFCPWNNWYWYALEYDTEDTFFGLVFGDEEELGYFSLKELTSIRGCGGLGIERDLYFKPKSLREVRQEHAERR